ncbi:MAG: IMP dehydrogenase [Chloroflexi bacterium RBG_13_50_21]|nr:MAG: IMP dehydrogenase [Chloroflexi bacterium RBG_13_50_21]
MKIRSDTGLTFDDVLLVPHRSAIHSRKDVSTDTWLVPGIRLSIPIISANMDTVTETRMAIAMAQLGGIGILHRFMTIEQQAECVIRVKRSESLVVESPLTVFPGASVEQARQRMEENDVGGLMVVDEDNHLLGIVTNRDVLLAPNKDLPMSQVMTPREKLVVASKDETMEEARRKLFEHRIEKLPLVDAEGHLAGLITAQDIIKIQQHPNATKDTRGRLRVGAAVGVRPDELERAASCQAAGVDALVVDIAHGHSDHVVQMLRRLKESFPNLPIIAGNVATAQGVKDLADAGADAVKVGVGSGSICTTRIVTGFGVPQLSAIAECAEAGKALNVPIIADGGIRNSGDLTKSLAAGASTVMLGGLLAGTDESPGATVIREDRRYKIVRGMASLSANIERRMLSNGELAIEEWGEVVPEGVEATVAYKGALVDVIIQLVGGLRSGLSYAGACSIEELWQTAEFIRITPSGMQESHAHDVELI